MARDPDKQFLLNGLRHGFSITKQQHRISPAQCNNYRSATCPENRPYVEAQITREIALGRYLVTSTKPTIISALGAIPKSDKPHSFRLIHDASRPTLESLNSYARPDSFSFTTVDSAIKLINPGDYLCKVDISEAYRHAGLHPNQYHMTGLQWQFTDNKRPTWFYDTRLPFGASESVGCFHRITQSITRMMRLRSQCHVLCYVDDLFIVSKDRQACAKTKDILIQLLRDLGFTIKWEKVVGPSQKLQFLGISLDSVTGTMSIPHGKLTEIRDSASSWITNKKVTKRDLQSMVGKISWVAKCVKAIRPILRTLIDLQKRLKRPFHHIRLPKQTQLDIRYFVHWAAHFNGTVFFRSMEKPSPENSVYTDASLTAGAAYHHGDFVYSYWAADMPHIASETIYIKELCAIQLAFRRWCSNWKNRVVHLFTDNKGAEWALKRGLTRNESANNILKEIMWSAAWNNIELSVHYVSSKNNCIADALSRIDNEQFLLFAARLLAKVGRYILHPSYNILEHMSPTSLFFLSQAFRWQKRRGWT